MSADSPVIPELLVALQGAKDATQAKGKADELSLAIKRSDIEALSTHSVLDTVSAWSLSKVEQERANAAITFGRLIVNLGAGTEAVFLPYLESLFNLLNEKTAAIRTSAQSALNTFVKICPPEATRLVFVVLRDCLKSLGGWRSQIGVLKALEAMVKEGATENVAAELGATIPLVEKAMHDTKAEVRFPLPLRNLHSAGRLPC
jgi:elongation factor 3